MPFFQSLGMTFGRDQNAFTSFDQTTYQLSLPNASPETLGKGMTFFADVLHRLLLSPKEIAEERQIIQEERRRSLSGRQRTMYYVLERIALGSIYGQRITIGTEETIENLQAADFRDYYGTWYTASNATVIVATDMAPAEVVALVQQHFGGAESKPKPEPQDAGVKAYEQSFAIVASDPEVLSEQVRIRAGGIAAGAGHDGAAVPRQVARPARRPGLPNLFGRELDYAWCHIAVPAGKLREILPSVRNHDLSMAAEMIFYLQDEIHTRDVDWLAWEDPFILERDPAELKRERENSLEETNKRLRYVLPMIETLTRLSGNGRSEHA